MAGLAAAAALLAGAARAQTRIVFFGDSITARWIAGPRLFRDWHGARAMVEFRLIDRMRVCRNVFPLYLP